MKFLSGFVLFLGLWATTVPLAQAAIAPVGPFTGSIGETWESFPNYTVPGPVTFLSDPTTIFGGDASISNPLMVIYEPSAGATFGLINSGSAAVSDGVKGMGINNLDFHTAPATITFATGVSTFGGYWGAATVGSDAVVAVSFFDAGGGLLGADSFTYNHESTSNGALDWHGWMSTTPIMSLTYSGNLVVNDGLQANVIPEPEIYVMLAAGLGLIGFVARRKKKPQENAAA